MGYAIYKPKGKAAEYSEWACNFYVGCSNQCEYCYLKKGVGAKVLGGNTSTLKKCFKDENHALEVFEKELKTNIPELQKHGLFFSFSTDPMLSNQEYVTWSAIRKCNDLNVPVKVLTKRADWVESYVYFIDNSNSDNESREWRKLIAFGFTLTGHDELEPYASANAERIEAMKQLHDAGFKTFASIEPIIDFDSSFQMIESTKGFCDLYKIGLKSGGKYSYDDTLAFYVQSNVFLSCNFYAKVYFKDSILKFLKIDRSKHLSSFHCGVGSEYDLFNLSDSFCL